MAEDGGRKGKGQGQTEKGVEGAVKGKKDRNLHRDWEI